MTGLEEAGQLVAGEARSIEQHTLLAWFDRNKRDLPWRRTRDPYAIWVSEIMLQQTRVAAVLEHYARWMARFPTVEELAAAEEPEVLAMWSGLGYYRRARFLHAGARAVVAEHGGVLPRTAQALRALPGIGEYTAAAVASIAFGEPVAVVDGNVERVVMRFKGLGDASPGLAQAIRSVAGLLLARDRPADWNQAMMELGATVCLPRAPLCLHCPLQPGCLTRGEHVAAPRKAMQARVARYALVQREGRGGSEILLTQRPAGAPLMAGMWELPELAGEGETAAPVLTVKHSITVTNYTVHIVPVAAGEHSQCLAASEGAAFLTQWVEPGALPEVALTGLARKVLKRLALWPKD